MRKKAVWGVLIWLVISLSPALCGDIVHDDDDAPKKPGCDNKFVLVGRTLLLRNFMKWRHFLFFLRILTLF